MLNVASRYSSDNVSEPRTGGHKGERSFSTCYGLIEMFSTYTRCHFVNNRYTFKPISKPVKQVHDSTPCDEETVRIS